MKLSNIKNSFSYHRYAIGVALIVACIAGLPQIIVKNKLGPADQGIPYLINDSEGEYLGRVHEVLDGYTSLASPMLYEYKDSVSLMLPTGEFIFYALPVIVTGLSLNTVVVVSKFLYPALLFLLAYLFIFSLLNKEDNGARISAIAGALLIVIGYEAYDYRNFVSYIIHGTTDSSGLLWNRLVNPITGAILLFGFLWSLSRIVKERARWVGIGISGLILAAMPGYIFSFALGLTITSCIGFYFIWRKNWTMTLRVYTPIVVALAFNAFYFARVFLALRGSVPASDPLKAGMLLTHEPLINLISLASLVGFGVCFLLFFRKDAMGEREKRWWFYSLASVSACLLVYNQQIITGRTVWPQHFVQYTTPLSMAVLVILLHNLVRSYAKNMWRVATTLLILAAVLLGWRGFQAATENTLPRYTKMQEFSGVFKYLNTHASKDCVVYASPAYPSEINRFIPAFTSCNDYHSFYIYYGIPNERIMHNYLVNLRLRDIKLQDVEKHFFAEDTIFFSKSYFYRDWEDVLCCGGWLNKIGDPEETQQWFEIVERDIERRYAEYLRGDLYEQLTRYRLDYFVVDTELQPHVNNKKYPFLSFKGQFGKFAVYEMMKQ